MGEIDKSIYMIYGFGYFLTVVTLMTLDSTILRKTYTTKRTFILPNDLTTYGNTIPKSDLQECTLWSGFQYHLIASLIVALIWIGINFFTPSLHKYLAEHIGSVYQK